MIALSIIDVKDFMNKLLIGEVFDRFFLVEASVTTFNTFTIDGRLQQDFFDTDTVAMHKSNSIEYSLWRDVKPYCFSVIRGRRTPLNFRIVLQLSHKQTQQILNPSFPDGSVPDCRFCLNLQYRNDSLLCTTGVSYTSFCLDKRPEHLWDEIIRKFLSGQHIAFQVL
ncbi:hypothetical protein Blut17040_08640 [Blautia luti]|jgi:hypothetical protein|uniref:Uncharacterized protein n=1 Tax=Blautia luti DSM 14534 = JCM 17040 TaxID=649762 RepID=A0A844GPA8_9FIRM|nr:DUF5721 family protein [Blautia luti]MTD62408.1 hypothetical protein [Blautia luti DSM 14534 = JCM 17040]RHQ90285.1 hypothetical protein DWX83_11245 [Ruminococcus sp. AF21-42]BEI59835.1 hypothetical protein Blut17040_08640 [Blautia luti]